ncbi:MAG: hypothetical protein LIP28_01090, partial [Deltaproteobacteria bacterium]|nr:hypothetical protein [Deltaproteobacteria bacterium]
MTGKPSDSRFAKTGRFFSILRQFPGRFRIAPAVVLLLLVLPFSAAAQRGAGISYLADDTAALTIESVS